MKGNNELHLCMASVVEAMQDYLKKLMGDQAPEITSVGFRQDTLILSIRGE